MTVTVSDYDSATLNAVLLEEHARASSDATYITCQGKFDVEAHLSGAAMLSSTSGKDSADLSHRGSSTLAEGA